jgi:hypothetical protein
LEAEARRNRGSLFSQFRVVIDTRGDTHIAGRNSTNCTSSSSEHSPLRPESLCGNGTIVCIKHARQAPDLQRTYIFAPDEHGICQFDANCIDVGLAGDRFALKWDKDDIIVWSHGYLLMKVSRRVSRRQKLLM